MFRTRYNFKRLSIGTAVVAMLAVVAVPSALARTDPWYRYAVELTTQQHQQQPQGYRFITDTLGGNGHATQAPERFNLITDTLGGNGRPVPTSSPQPGVPMMDVGNGKFIPAPAVSSVPSTTRVTGYDPQAYVYGGASPALAQAIQSLGNHRTATPTLTLTSSPSGTSFHWGDAGIGAGVVAGLTLLLLGGTRLRPGKRGVLAA